MAVIVDIAFWAPVWATDGDATARPKRGVDAEEFALFARAVAQPLPRRGRHLHALERAQPPRLPAAPAAAPRRLYRDMVAAAYPAVKDEAPDSTVLVGGLAAHGRRDGTPPLRFLRELACVDRRLQPVTTGDCADFKPIEGDGFAHHPYSTRTRPDEVERSASPDDVPLARIGRLIGMLDRLAAAGRISPELRDVYITEYAYESNPPDPRRALQPRAGGADDGLRRGAGRARAAGAHASPSSSCATCRAPGRAASRWASCSDWQSGLLFADRRPKPLAARAPRAAPRRAGGPAVRAAVGPGAGPARAGAGCGSRPRARRASVARAGRRPHRRPRHRGGRGARAPRHGVQDRAPRGRALGLRAAGRRRS